MEQHKQRYKFLNPIWTTCIIGNVNPENNKKEGYIEYGTTAVLLGEETIKKTQHKICLITHVPGNKRGSLLPKGTVFTMDKKVLFRVTVPVSNEPSYIRKLRATYLPIAIEVYEKLKEDEDA